jgi:cobalt/nickel transport system permease protein
MHIANGIVNMPVSALFVVVAFAALAWCVLRGRQDLDDRLAPMAGLVAAFIFAVQMLNFQVLPGVSGHLLGGALAAMLVGPWVGALCVATVLVVQCLLFADGGLTALGTNVTLLGVVAIAVGYGAFRALRAVLPRHRGGLLTAAGVGAFLSVPVAALVFVGLFALGGVADVPLGTVAVAMGGVHLLIGLGEAAITVAVLGAVLAVRPDLVHSAAAGSPLADYAVTGVGSERLSGGLAGVVGVAVTLLLVGGLTLLVRRRDRDPAGRED